MFVEFVDMDRMLKEKEKLSLICLFIPNVGSLEILDNKSESLVKSKSSILFSLVGKFIYCKSELSVMHSINLL